MWTIALYELKRHLRNPPVMALLLLAPLLLIFILGSALSEVFGSADEDLEPIALVYYDEDLGTLSEAFRTYLRGLEEGGHFEAVEAGARSEAVRRVKDGEAQVGLFIPAGFSESVLSGQEARWEFLPGSDDLNNLVGRMLLETFIGETNRAQAAAVTLGPAALGDAAFPAAVDDGRTYVESGKLGSDGRSYSALQYYASSMLVMFLLYSGLTAAISLQRERETHTWTRMLSTPIRMPQTIRGKLLGNGALSALQAAFIIGVTGWLYGADWGGSFHYVALICLLTIFASMGLSLLVSYLFRSTKAIAGVFGGFIGLMTFASGGMMPTDGTALEIAKPFTVNFWASNSFLRIMVESDRAGVHHNLIVLALIGVAFFAIAMFLYRKAGSHE